MERSLKSEYIPGIIYDCHIAFENLLAVAIPLCIQYYCTLEGWLLNERDAN